MKLRLLLCCLVALLGAFPILAEEAEVSKTSSTPPAGGSPLDCPEIGFESFVEIADWAVEIGAVARAMPASSGSLPQCPTPIPSCPGLTPVGCPPDASCKKTVSCTTNDLGFRKCTVDGTKISCPPGQTFHTRTCACTPICEGAFCGNSRDVFCQ